MKNVLLLLSNELLYFSFYYILRDFAYFITMLLQFTQTLYFKDCFLTLYAFSSPPVHVVHAFRCSKARTFQDRLHMKSYSSADQTQLMHSVSTLQSDFQLPDHQ